MTGPRSAAGSSHSDEVAGGTPDAHSARRKWFSRRSLFGPRSPLFRKYALQLSVFAVLIISVAVAVMFVTVFKSTLNSSYELQASRASAAAQRINSEIGAIERLLREAATLPWTARGLRSEALEVELKRLMKIAPVISSVDVHDAGSGVATSAMRSWPGLSSRPSDDDERKLIALAHASEVAFGPPFPSPAGPMNVRLAMCTNPDCTVSFIATMSLQILRASGRELQFGHTGQVFVLDADDAVIAHPNPFLAFQHTLFGSVDFVRALRSNASGKTGAVSAFGRSDDGRFVLATAAPLIVPGWIVVATEDALEAAEPVISGIFSTLLLLVFGVAVALAVASMLAQGFSRPIQRMTALSESIGSGDFQSRLPVESSDELGTLSIQFNKMADQVQDYTTSLAQKVSEKTAQLELANRHKSEFLANMSHELRTPLNAVIGFSDVLTDEYFGPLNEKQHRYLRDINESGQHLLTLINDILDLSKVEAGRMDLDLTEFALSHAIDNAVVLVRERALRQQLQLKQSVPDEVGTVVADERKFKQILINLLTNAVKFTPPGGSIAVSACRTGDEIQVTVHDSGIGIAAEQHEAVFHEFTQLRSAAVDRHEGTGLGLSLVRRLVELHGGWIRLESAPGKGSAFTFSIPQPAATGSAARVDSVIAAGAAHPAGSPAPGHS